MRSVRVGVYLLWLASACLACKAQAQTIVRSVVALQGGIAPGGPSPFSSGFANPVIAMDGTIVFTGWVDAPGPDEQVIFAGRSAADLRRVVQSGQRIPSPAGRYATLDDAPAVSAAGGIAFSSALSETPAGGQDNSARFRVRTDGGSPRVLAQEGEILSRGGGMGAFATNGNLVQAATINALGQSAFQSLLSVSHPTLSRVYGLFIASDQGNREIIRSGDIAPGMARISEWFTNPLINDAGEVSFAAYAGLSASWSDCVYVTQSGAVTLVARRGMSNPGGGTFDSFPAPTRPNRRGEVALTAFSSGSCCLTGMFRAGPGALVPIARVGQTAPGGGTFRAFDRYGELNERGEVAFNASVSDNGNQDALFVGDGVSLRVVARAGMPAPGGGTFYAFLGYPIALNDAGQVLFQCGIRVPVGAGTQVRDAVVLFDPNDGLFELARVGEAWLGSSIESLYLAGASISRGPAPGGGTGLGAPFQATFRFRLADGRSGIAVVNPDPDSPVGPPGKPALVNALDRSLLRADSRNPSGASFVQPFANYTRDGKAVEGFAGDGVATVAVVFRFPQPGSVTLELSGSDGIDAALGTITTVSGTSASGPAGGRQTLVVTTELVGQDNVAVALVQAPDAFERPGVAADAGLVFREATVRAWQSPTDVATQVIRVGRPPLVFVHGLWATGATWDPIDPFVNAGFWVGKVDYGPTNGRAFAINDEIVSEQIWQYIDLFTKQTGLAAAQAMVVGHSMGGLLTRRVVGGQVLHVPFRDPRNRGEGTVDRFITIASPHRGAIAATLLVTSNGTPIPITSTLMSLAEGCVTCGAVRDLRPDSQAIQTLPDTRSAGVPTHAIVGTGGRGWVAVGSLVGSIASDHGAVGRFVEVMARLLRLYQGFVFGNLEHDLIVGEPSARGGLSGDSVSTFGFSPTPFLGGCHIGLPDEDRTKARVIEVLKQLPSAPVYASGFPPVPPPFEQPWSIPLFGAPGGLRLVGPQGAVRAGQSVSIGVESFGEFVASRVMLISRSGVQDSPVGGMAIYPIPIDSPTGPVTLQAFATNVAGDATLSDPIIINIEAPAPLVAIRLEPALLRLSEHVPGGHVRTVGLFGDNVERVLSPSSPDLVLQSESPEVAVMSATEPGRVEANRAGSTIITASMLGLTAQASVVVAPQQCPADLAAPWGVLDSSDAVAFAAFEASGDPLADLASPFGVVDERDAAEFDRLVHSHCGLRPVCLADFNGNDAVSLQDLFDFVTAWFAGVPSADVNGIGGVSLQDLFDFLTAWFAGC